MFGIIAQFLPCIFVRYFLDSCTVKCYSISPSINQMSMQAWLPGSLPSGINMAVLINPDGDAVLQAASHCSLYSGVFPCFFIGIFRRRECRKYFFFCSCYFFNSYTFLRVLFPHIFMMCPSYCETAGMPRFSACPFYSLIGIQPMENAAMYTTGKG